jgi:hypothetical protein
MLSIRNCLFLLLSIAVASGSGKDRPKFTPGPASSYPSRQTVSNVTIAAVPYDTEELARTAFGKVNPYKYGILPVLVVIQNDGKQVLRLDSMQVQYTRGDRSRIEATPPQDVPYTTGGPKQPSVTPTPIPARIPGVGRKKKSPLSVWEIEGRAFAARMIPPGESASGFFYFQTAHRPGSSLYLTGIREAATGKELFYFEIPLEAK